MALTECIKSCCKNFIDTKREQEQDMIEMRRAPDRAAGARGGSADRKGVDVDDYILSKLPPDGKEIPFVLPTFKSSYVQPGTREGYHLGQQSSSATRSTYAERKAEILRSNNVDITFHPGQLGSYLSPGPVRQGTAKNRKSISHGSGWNMKSQRRRLSSSMGDLPSNESHTMRISSVSSVRSCSSSLIDFLECSRSLESVNSSGEESRLGKLCVRLSFQEAVEQLWITLVQCTDLCLPEDSIEQHKIGIKGIITMAKPVDFKSSVKEVSQNIEFMETFVFPLQLQQLRRSALVLRLRSYYPRKLTLAECVLSLRQLGPEEIQHWLDLTSPSKPTACHAELNLATCFQPVSGRMQLQILTAQNLPAPALAPLSLAFFVKAELYQMDRVVMKRKTSALKSSEGQCHWRETFHFPLAGLDQGFQLTLKLYSRSTVRRTQFLGQVDLGFDSPTPEAVEQWRDTIGHPEKVVTTWHSLNTGS